jgi:hypothetical protein
MRFGRGFSKRNLWQMRAFYLAWPLQGTVSAKSSSSLATVRAGRIVQTLSAQLRGALAGLSNTVLAAEYRTTLPHERLLAEEIARTRRQLDIQRQEALRSPPRAARRTGQSRRSTRASSRASVRSLKAAGSQA